MRCRPRAPRKPAKTQSSWLRSSTYHIRRRLPGSWLAFAERGSGCRHACDRHAERRARHVIEPGSVAELHARRLATVLAADADLEAGLGGATTADPELDQCAHAFDVEDRERIGRQDVAI